DRNKPGCDAVVDDLKAAGITHARAWTLDVDDPDAFAAVVPDIASHFGGIDIIVNNAGFAKFALVDDEAAYEESWEKSLAVMLSAHQRIVREALPWLRQSDAARIVNVASTEGLGATPGNSPYVAAKHGVIGITRGLAVDLGKEGITVNCICPGPIRTSINAEIPEDQKTIFAKRRTALKRYGDPEEVAHITLACVLPSASYLTGAVIPVDGGLTIRNA
ncbi:MAG: SDR family NAD(P)-dependent oxidoreductase, partial [Pseudomonadota bacterium]